MLLWHPVKFDVGMALIMEVLSGPLFQHKFLLREGVCIGRTQGEILIPDPKVSGRHAQVETDGKDHLILRDLNSANGLIINGHRVRKVVLLPGVAFLIGRTSVKVEFVPENEVYNHVARMGWRRSLREGLENLRISSSPPPDQLMAFDPQITLLFTQGTQTDQIINLGYGPRLVGRDVLDIELKDPDAPSVAFEIAPRPNRTAQIINKSGSLVKINSQPFIVHEIKEGDLVELGQSTIRLGFS